MKIVFRGQVFQKDLASAAAETGVDYHSVSDETALFKELENADALWITPSCYSANVASFLIENTLPLRWLSLTSGGYDILTRRGSPKGVHLTYAAGVHGPSVAEHAVAQLMCLARRFPEVLKNQRDRNWNTDVVKRLTSLEDMNVTIIGLGSIGQQIAIRLRPLVKSITAVTRTGKSSPLVDQSNTLSQLDETLGLSDAVILALPLNEDSHELLTSTRIARLKEGALVVNVSRGSMIDQKAMCDALYSGKLGGAALDVTDPEPLPPDSLLWSAPNTLITPHISSFGNLATGKRLAALFAKNVLNLKNGIPLEGLVDL